MPSPKPTSTMMVRVGERTHEVTTWSDGRVTVDGVDHETSTVEPGVIGVRGPDARQWRVAVGGTPRPDQAAVDGLPHDVLVRTATEAALDDALGASAAAEGDGRIAAPMPGRVVTVAVSPGERVEAGAPVVVVEAMKMENELLAPTGGTVAEVLVSAGETVDADQLLVRLEPDEG